MDPGIDSQSRAANEKQLLPSASSVPGQSALDNNRNQNNNDTVDVHCPPFLPSRDRFNSGYRGFDDNRSVSSHRNSACVESLYSPRMSWLSSRGGRRHSIGLEEVSDVNVYRGHRNFNQETMPPAFHNSPVTRCSSDTAANSSSVVERSKLICQSELEFAERENQNQGRDIEFTVRSACNGRPFNAANFNPTHSREKFKDKSFVRKSSLNRLEFVEQACHNAAHKPQVSACNQQSSSEANSDRDHSWSRASVSSFAKRKSSFGHNSEKELCGGLNRQDAVPEAVGVKKGGWFFKHREGSLKFRHRKSPSSLTFHFKKSLSAGEQDSFTDFSENVGVNKVCFSAQEIHPQELFRDRKHKESSPLPQRRNSPEPSFSQEPSSPDVLNKGSQTASSISPTCDNSSHISGSEQLPKSDVCDAGKEVISHLAHSHGLEEACQDNTDIDCHTEHLDIDQDLFDSHGSVISSPLQRFPTDDQPDEWILSESHKVSEASHLDSACNHQNVAEESPSEVAAEGIESLSIKNSTLESDKESVKQLSSILRKKSSEERRERHGILKNADDKLASRFLPSILKHRESSEEKDVWNQSDLHSILKKSTSEDDSSNNSPDIRPILKNTSTDDESSGMSSKPKPILKKRTSFSEECSYVCFHSGELKPILKKKSMIDMCEEQPKPILKTRRKSEEAAATTLEFAIGSRPRAYSADRGVKKSNDKKPGEDLS